MTGLANPSGRLPFTIAKQESDYSAKVVTDPPGIVEYSEGVLIGYRWFDDKGIDPLFPFGFGLSYTTFEYSRINVKQIDTTRYSVGLQVLNTGHKGGWSIVQLYLSYPESVKLPPMNLKSFKKVFVAAGGVEKVFLSLARI